MDHRAQDMPPPVGGWHPDPTGRFVSRYHDGSGWSSWVTDPTGRSLQDPLASPVGPFGPPPAAGPAPGPPGRVAPWVPVVLGLGTLLLLAGLLLLPWVDADDGQFSDVRRALLDAEDAGAEIDGWLLDYVEWGYWVVGGLSVGLALAAVYGRRRLSSGVRTALIAVVSLLVALPVVLLTLIAQGLNEAGKQEGTAGPMVAGLVVAALMVGLFAACTFVPAHVMTILVAGSGLLWHLYALGELSDGDADLELGATIGWIGYVALAAAALAGRRQRWSGPTAPSR